MIFIILLVSVIFAGMLGNYSRYRFNYTKEPSWSYDKEAVLTGKQFEQIYTLNPEKWRFSKIIRPGFLFLETNEKFLLYSESGKWSYCAIESPYKFNNREEIVRVHLTFFAWLKYLYFNNIFERKNKNDGLVIILESAQKDIDELKKQAQREIDQASHDMKNIINKER